MEKYDLIKFVMAEPEVLSMSVEKADGETVAKGMSNNIRTPLVWETTGDYIYFLGQRFERVEE